MHAVRLYDSPEQFAEMMVRQITEGMGVVVRQQENEPLLLKISLDPNDPADHSQVSLHNAYHTYRAGGDLNVAMDQLNGILSAMRMTSKKEEFFKLDAAYIFPAIREERYVEEAGHDILSEPYLPGLRVIFIEIKDECSKIVNESMLNHNPGLTADKAKRIAYQNLRRSGWQYPRLRLQCPTRNSCTVDVFMENPHPIECQFLLPEISTKRMPANCVIAFSNRQVALMLRSTERMVTEQQVLRLVEKSKFREVVKRSYHLMPNPVSEQLFWIAGGQARLLKAAKVG